jgi:hypothetical protein
MPVRGEVPVSGERFAHGAPFTRNEQEEAFEEALQYSVVPVTPILIVAGLPVMAIVA